MNFLVLISCCRLDAAQTTQCQDRSAYGLAPFLPCLLGTFYDLGDPNMLMYACLVLWTDVVALRHGNVVLVHEATRPRFL